MLLSCERFKELLISENFFNEKTSVQIFSLGCKSTIGWFYVYEEFIHPSLFDIF